VSDPLRRVAERRALLGLDAIYRDVSTMQTGWSCARSGECCQLAQTRREPDAWKVEWLRVQAALRRAGTSMPPPRGDGACPLLTSDGRCSVHADRPLGCRTFFCERGSGPTAISRERITALMVRLERVAQELEPDESGPRPLLAWIADAREP
jgi:Fe-S-cluster containining protein